MKLLKYAVLTIALFGLNTEVNAANPKVLQPSAATAKLCYNRGNGGDDSIDRQCDKVFDKCITHKNKSSGCKAYNKKRVQVMKAQGYIDGI